MNSLQLLVIGGGFAGLWSALGAARKLDEQGLDSSSVRITLINRDPYHTIRVRLYESDLKEVRLYLPDILAKAEIDLQVGEVTSIDTSKQTVALRTADSSLDIYYDRLILASGSKLFKPSTIKGIENAFSVDTYDEAMRLNDHLNALPAQARSAARDTVLVIGAGLTGLEVSCELPKRLKEIFKSDVSPIRVVIADHSEQIGSDMGSEARVLIEEALAQLGIQTLVGFKVSQLDLGGAILSNGDRIESNTIIWTAGMRASALSAMVASDLDRFGRVMVDEFLRVQGIQNVFAAGDVANLLVDGIHHSVMSCQHGRPMGRFAGHNAIADLLDQPLLPLKIPDYVTVLDLGPWGAIYTKGWDRKVVRSGMQAKLIKQEINQRRIYPPKGSRRALLDAASPVVQSIPKYD